MIKFYFITKEQYNNLSSINNDILYFISDTKQIYKGNTSYTDSIINITSIPSKIDQSKFYYNTNKKLLSVYLNNKWDTISLNSEISTTLDFINDLSNTFEIKEDYVNVKKDLNATEATISAINISVENFNADLFTTTNLLVDNLSIDNLKNFKTNNTDLCSIFSNYLPLTGGNINGNISVTKPPRSFTGNDVLRAADLKTGIIPGNNISIEIQTDGKLKISSNDSSENLDNKYLPLSGGILSGKLTVPELEISNLTANNSDISAGDMNIDNLSIDEATISIGSFEIGKFIADSLSVNTLSSVSADIDAGNMNLETLNVENADISVGQFSVDNLIVNNLSIDKELNIGSNVTITDTEVIYNLSSKTISKSWEKLLEENSTIDFSNISSNNDININSKTSINLSSNIIKTKSNITNIDTNNLNISSDTIKLNGNLEVDGELSVPKILLSDDKIVRGSGTSLVVENTDTAGRALIRTSSDSATGADIYIYGKDYSGAPGEIRLTARTDSSTQSSLVLRPNKNNYLNGNLEVNGGLTVNNGILLDVTDGYRLKFKNNNVTRGTVPQNSSYIDTLWQDKDGKIVGLLGARTTPEDYATYIYAVDPNSTDTTKYLSKIVARAYNDGTGSVWLEGNKIEVQSDKITFNKSGSEIRVDADATSEPDSKSFVFSGDSDGSSTGKMILYSSNSYKNGPSVFLYGKNYNGTNGGDKNSIALYVPTDSGVKTLLLKEDGSLSWCGLFNLTDNGRRIFIKGTSSNFINLSQQNITKGTIPDSTRWTEIFFTDKNNAPMGIIGNSYETTGTIKSYISVAKNKTTGNFSLNLINTKDDVCYATVPSPPSTATGDEIATAKWVNSKLTSSGGVQNPKYASMQTIWDNVNNTDKTQSITGPCHVYGWVEADMERQDGYGHICEISVTINGKIIQKVKARGASTSEDISTSAASLYFYIPSGITASISGKSDRSNAKYSLFKVPV